MIFDVFLFVKTCDELILEEHSTVNSSITHTPLGKSSGYGFLESMWFGYSGNVGTKIYCMSIGNFLAKDVWYLQAKNQ